MLSSSYPQFAVVGHPNKGKSSIVSSLALDDSVQISDTPGTTTQKRSFPLKVDGNIIYELFDTPGFQRARSVLAWLEKHDVSADKRYEVVEQFIHTHKENPKYNDEIELLEPVIAGAGIIYVVDASNPYGEEYEAEMEILRWTGQPSMALINHIGEDDYAQEWKRALGQYFKSVRTYNPMDMSLAQHLSILESMAQLKEEWTASVKTSITFFQQYYDQMIGHSALNIAKVVYDSLSHVEELTFEENDASTQEKALIETRYKEYLRVLEKEAQKRVEGIWNHTHIEKIEEVLLFEDMDLFSEETASVFGLTKKELLLTGVASGAATGAGVDLLLGGTTLLLGSGIGAIVGGIGAFFAFDELSEIKVLGHTLGKKYLEMGPMENRNFPYILLGRMLYHTSKIAKRSHAKRDTIALEMNTSFKGKWLEEDLNKSLEKYHKIFRSDSIPEAEILSEYQHLVKSVLVKLLDSQ